MHKVVCALSSSNKIFFLDLPNKIATQIIKGEDFYPYFSPWAHSPVLNNFLVKNGRTSVAILDDEFKVSGSVDLKNRVRHLKNIKPNIFSIICTNEIFILRLEKEERILDEVTIPSEIKVKRYLDRLLILGLLWIIILWYFSPK